LGLAGEVAWRPAITNIARKPRAANDGRRSVLSEGYRRLDPVAENEQRAPVGQAKYTSNMSHKITCLTQFKAEAYTGTAFAGSAKNIQESLP
jgi:hypothetical protein